jgi:Arc/MetJ-type ribon-helix-helix transcriptional regulator
MNVKLTPEQEQIIKGALKDGRFRTAEEVIGQALETLQRDQRLNLVANDRPGANQELAVRKMLAFVKKNHVRLVGISVKDLIREGHRL